MSLIIFYAKLNSIMKNKKITKKSELRTPLNILFFIITVIAGIWTLYPFINFQHHFSMTLHGHELYSFKNVFDGLIPYRDFYWDNGPLMPYFYNLCFKLFGISIQSVLLGETILLLLNGIIIYFICTSFLSTPLSFIGALWYWRIQQLPFAHSYNYSGETLFFLFSILCLIRFIKEPIRGWVFLGYLSFILLILVNIKLGLLLLIPYIAISLLIDHINKNLTPKRIGIHFLFSTFAILFTGAIYFFLLKNIPLTIIEQYFFIQHPVQTSITPLISFGLPICGILLFYALGLGLQKMKFRYFVIIIFCLLTIIRVYKTNKNITANKIKTNQLQIANTKIFLNPNSNSWRDIATQTTEFLKNNIHENETFGCIPSNDFYHFMLRKKNPNPLPFRLENISPDKEKTIIDLLEKNHTQWIILSNNLHHFGITQGFELSHYIENNYKIMAEFGDWSKSSDEEYATRILKRK